MKRWWVGTWYLWHVRRNCHIEKIWSVVDQRNRLDNFPRIWLLQVTDDGRLSGITLCSSYWECWSLGGSHNPTCRLSSRWGLLPLPLIPSCVVCCSVSQNLRLYLSAGANKCPVFSGPYIWVLLRYHPYHQLYSSSADFSTIQVFIEVLLPSFDHHHVRPLRCSILFPVHSSSPEFAYTHRRNNRYVYSIQGWDPSTSKFQRTTGHIAHWIEEYVEEKNCFW